jgi:zinc/manganese transport system substrate-binding protein
MKGSGMKKRSLSLFLTLGAMILTALCLGSGPAMAGQTATAGSKTIVTTYSILGSIVKDLVGDACNVRVMIPNGLDPHEWEASAKDVAAMMKADMIVQNGLDLEGGMQNSLAQAKDAGVKFFTAADHIKVRRVGPGEGLPTGDPDQAVGAQDPHIWMDPVDMKQVVTALADQIRADLGIDLSARAAGLEKRLDRLNEEIAALCAGIPQAHRKLVTGHESMGYFAQRYGFKLVGAMIPSLTTQAEVSAADLANLKMQIRENRVKAIFTELGTPSAVVHTISEETGVKVVELTTHSLPEDGSYFTFMHNVATTITDALK